MESINDGHIDNQTNKQTYSMTTELSEIFLSNLGGIEYNNLITILDIDTNEIIPSLYFEADELTKTQKYY